MLPFKTILAVSSLVIAASIQPSAPPRSAAAPAASAVLSVCDQTAARARLSKEREVKSDFFLAMGICANLTDPAARADCIAQAYEDQDEGFDLAEAQFEERLDLCSDLGGGAYDPEIDPEDFVDYVDNPFFPLVPGTVRTYEKQTADGLETVVFTVTHQTKEILGVECIVVNDVVSLEGEVVEDTLDYFAQDEQGNVWYFGELSRDFEDGELVSIDGTWRADRDGAKAGIIMEAAPQVGDVYRQEFSLGNAEDVAEVISLNASAQVPYGSFAHCLKTEDFSPLDPDAEELKYYAAGIGSVLELNPATGERLELVSVTP